MKTHEIISMQEAELVSALKTMPVEEMEAHAKQIVSDLGSDNYGGLMKQAMQTIQDSDASTNRFDLVKQLIKESMPNEAIMSDIYGRLAAIMIVIISRKLTGIMAKS